MATLANEKRHVTGLELAETAVEEARKELQRRGVPEDWYELESGDFFAHKGQYDVIYDYTFFCAIPPGLREDWGKQMASLLKKSGTLVTLMFPMKPYVSKRADGPKSVHSDDADYKSGPPFLLKEEFYKKVLEPHGLECVRIEQPSKSHPGREGMEKIALWKFKADA